MTIHIAIESESSLVELHCPAQKSHKVDFFKIDKNPKKSVKTQMHTIFFIDLHLISSLNVQKKIWIFFDRVQWTHLTMVPKANQKRLFSYVKKKKNSTKNQLGSMFLTVQMIFMKIA
jgi:hypothetical protein